MPLVHVPPGVRSNNAVVAPVHTVAVPPIATGNGFTVIGLVMKQPVGNVNVMVALPAATPVTVPVPEPMVAIEVLLLVHVDVPEASASVVLPPTHTEAMPVIADGSGLTVNTAVAVQPVGKV